MKTEVIIQITVTNHTRRLQKIYVANIGQDYNKPNHGLPDGVSITLATAAPGINAYTRFLQAFRISPEMVYVKDCTNPRQLNFWMYSMFGEARAMQPQLTKDGTPREKIYVEEYDYEGFESGGYRYKKRWNPKKWNIADTHERFIMHIGTQIQLDIKRGQDFKITLAVLPWPGCGPEIKHSRFEFRKVI